MAEPETPVKEGTVFEIVVQTSAAVWPPACEGSKKVFSAVRELLLAAEQGSSVGFDSSTVSLEEAVSEWRTGLWGEK